MRKETKDGILYFHDVKVHASAGGEFLRIEDPDITEKCFYDPTALSLPDQAGQVTWETGNGYFSMTGKINADYLFTVRLFPSEADAIAYYSPEDTEML